MEFTITNIICIITAGVSFYGFQNPDFKIKLLHWPNKEHKFSEYYRWVTHAFLHADITHLLFNMLALWSFGNNVEQYFKMVFGEMAPVYYFILYFGAVIAACIPSFIRQKDNYAYTSLGASGGTSAIMFASLIFSPWSTILIYFIPVPAIIGGVGFLVYSTWASRNSRDNIAHDAHFWGAIFGFVFPILMQPQLLDLFMSLFLAKFQ